MGDNYEGAISFRRKIIMSVEYWLCGKNNNMYISTLLVPILSFTVIKVELILVHICVTLWDSGVISESVSQLFFVILRVLNL